MKGLIVLTDSDSDGGDSCTSSSDDQNPPPAANAYSCADDRKRQRPGEEVVIPASLLLNVYIVLVVEVYELVRGRTVIFLDVVKYVCVSRSCVPL